MRASFFLHDRLHPFILPALVITSLLLGGCGRDSVAEGEHDDHHGVRVCTTTPDLGAIVEAIGGEHVTVTTFAGGSEDPHVIEILPDHVRELARAELLVVTGLDLEEAWLGQLQEAAGNEQVQPGAAGHLDISDGMRSLEEPGGVPQSLHPEDNPHFLLDPLEGWRAAEAIHQKLVSMHEEHRDYFDSNLEAFQAELAEAMLGPSLAAFGEDVVALVLLAENGELDQHLAAADISAGLGGWLGAMEPFRGEPIVGDHDLWPYMARRFGLDVVGYMEPEPGVDPTTRHLRALLGEMSERDVRLILSSPYFDPRHGRFLAENSDARLVEMAHMPGAREGAADYIAMIDHNVRAMAAALREAEASHE